MYNDFDRDLFERRVRAKRIFRQYNRTDDENTGRRHMLLMQLFRHLGQNVWIEPDFRCEFGKNITIGSRVWIGGNVTVLPGVSIGNDTIIGAGSVVTHDVPAGGGVAAGNPCRVLRHVTGDDKLGFVAERH